VPCSIVKVYLWVSFKKVEQQNGRKEFFFLLLGGWKAGGVFKKLLTNVLWSIFESKILEHHREDCTHDGYTFSILPTGIIVYRFTWVWELKSRRGIQKISYELLTINLYNNDFTSIIDVYFHETFSNPTSQK